MNRHKVEIGNVRIMMDSMMMLSRKTKLFARMKKSLSIKSETSGSSLPELFAENRRQALFISI